MFAKSEGGEESLVTIKVVPGLFSLVFQFSMSKGVVGIWTSLDYADGLGIRWNLMVLSTAARQTSVPIGSTSSF